MGYQSQRISVEGEVNDASGVQLIVDIDDPADQNNFYYFRNSEAIYVLETQLDLYTPSPANIRVNMIILDDPEERVLGFFIAAGESREHVHIKNS